MRLKKTALLFLCLFLLFCCTGQMSEKEKEKIYHEKGCTTMKHQLKPEIIRTDKVNKVLGLNLPDTFGTVSPGAEFALASIDKKGIIDITPVVPGFPPDFGEKYYSDDEHNVMWMTRGRGFYAVDIETKTTGHIIVSQDPNDGMLNTFLANPKDKIFFITIAEFRISGNRSFYILYDLLNNKIIHKSDYFKGFFYPFNNDFLLFCEIYGEGNTLLRWHVVDYQNKEQEDNKLAKELTKIQFHAWDRTKTIHTGKRHFLGTTKTSDTLIYISALWDEETEKVKVEPFTIQRPKDSLLDDAFLFSQKGTWVKTTIESTHSNFPVPYLAFYHADRKYPQGLSLPIYAGLTKDSTPGAFMIHSEWGECYIEQDGDYPDKLFIYKLNEGLTILAEQAREGLGT